MKQANHTNRRVSGYGLAGFCGAVLAVLLAACAAGAQESADRGGVGARVEATVRYMASIPSRLSGYPGSEKAADYIAASLKQAGVEEVTR